MGVCPHFMVTCTGQDKREQQNNHNYLYFFEKKNLIVWTTEANFNVDQFLAQILMCC